MKKRKKRRSKGKKIAVVSVIFIICTSLTVVGIKKYLCNKENLYANAPISKNNKQAVNLNNNNSSESGKNNSITDKQQDGKDKNNGSIPSNSLKSTSDQSSMDSSIYEKQDSKAYKSAFNNDIFLGDSITEGLSFYDILNDTNVVGIKGISTIKAMNYVNEVTKSSPKNIYILLGDNDLELGGSSQDFKNSYAKLIQAIKSKLPQCNIYVQTILPVKTEVGQRNSLMTNARINEFNSAMEEMAKEQDVNFIDITPIIKNSSKDLYEPDGIHPKCDFDYYWLNYLQKNTK